MERIERGIMASGGIAVAPAYIFKEQSLKPDEHKIEKGQEQSELDRFSKALAKVTDDLKQLQGKDQLFAAHLTLVKDPMLQESVEGKIKKEQKNAQMAVSEAISEYAGLFDGMDDPYMDDRAADVRDIGKQILAVLKDVDLPNLGVIDEPCIVLAEDLYPSDAIKLNPAFVKGILTEKGGVNSHVSIIAKSFDIPMLVDVSNILSRTRQGDLICMDALDGRIVLRPDEETQLAYKDKQEVYEAERSSLAKLRGVPTVTSQGKRIFLCANVGTVAEIKRALTVKVNGIGLFRTEFLYMQSTQFPTEEEQFAAYRKAAEMVPQGITIRTLDIGGEKQLPYFQIEKEENPSLGYRGIRLSLDQTEVFKAQLRAILRASAFGHVRILFPMINSPAEFQEAKALVQECKDELRTEGQPFDENIELGIMMETPASVLLADTFAEAADFFSIGTNDLTQYLLAVDRSNERVASKYDYFHPAVKKAIGQVIEAGHRVGIRVGMCGEMAGDPKATKLLLDLGLDEFSMSAGCVDAVRAEILKA